MSVKVRTNNVADLSSILTRYGVRAEDAAIAAPELWEKRTLSGVITREVVVELPDRLVVDPQHRRVLTEAKRQLVFTRQPIHEIAYDLAFSDPSHFARFFRKQTGTTPHEFRAARGG